MRRLIAGLCCAMMLAACMGKQGETAAGEDTTAKQMLQGIWIDDETDMPQIHVKGDSIYYADPQNVPVAFQIRHDTIYLYGSRTLAYRIDRQTEYSFWFHALEDEIMRLHKSENPEDALVFNHQEVEVISTTTEVVKKDSVVMYKGTRYHGYVYINPSKMKVIKTSYSEGGIGVDNVYYDNVIHICIYEGKRELYGKDITKKMFKEIFPDELLQQLILADMDFMGVDDSGYRYRATLSLPESSVYNLVNLTIGFDNRLDIKKAE